MLPVKPLKNVIDDRYDSVSGFLDVYCADPANGCFFRKISSNAFDEHSYKELRTDSFRLAKTLIDEGYTKKGIAFIAENRYEHYVCMFASFMAGAVYIPLNPAADVPALAAMMSFSDARAVIASRVFFDPASQAAAACGIKTVICLDSGSNGEPSGYGELLKKGKNYDASRFYGRFDDRRTSMLCFTSGTAGGKPKCVELTCENLFATVRHCLHDQVDVFADDFNRFMYSPLPTFHLANFCSVISYTIPFGGTCCTSTAPRDSMRDVRILQPGFMQIVPALAKAFLAMIEGEVARCGDTEKFAAYCKECDNNSYSYEHRRKLCAKYLDPIGGKIMAITLAGAVAETDVVRRLEYFGISCSCDYGLTECSPAVSFDLNRYKRIGAVGRLLPYMDAKIVDGVLYLRGENVMKGYYKNPEATKDALSADGWLYSGDIAEIDEDGYLFIKGRASSVVVLSNGDNIDTDELAALFTASPAIAEIIIMADKKNNNDTLGALIYPADGKGYDNVRAAVSEINKSLPVQKRVVRFRLVDAPFEKNEMLKIKRFLYLGEEV